MEFDRVCFRAGPFPGQARRGGTARGDQRGRFARHPPGVPSSSVTYLPTSWPMDGRGQDGQETWQQCQQARIRPPHTKTIGRGSCLWSEFALGPVYFTEGAPGRHRAVPSMVASSLHGCQSFPFSDGRECHRESDDGSGTPSASGVASMQVVAEGGAQGRCACFVSSQELGRDGAADVRCHRNV